MNQGTLSQRAAALAVVVAFLVGIVGSLALRPPGSPAAADPITKRWPMRRLYRRRA